MPHLGPLDNIVQFFMKGGFFMGLLLVCSLAALTVILLRLAGLRRRAVIPPLIEREIGKMKPGEEPEHLRHLVQDDDSALSNILEVVVRPFELTKQEVMDLVQTRARQEIVRLEGGLFILEIIVGIAPLLGLLGAVNGLIRVFGNIGSGVTSTTDLKGIAGGIGEALSTTIVGLAIAIPSLIAFSYFSRRIERLAVEMECLVTDLIEKMFHRSRPKLDAESAKLEEAVR